MTPQSNPVLKYSPASFNDLKGRPHSDQNTGQERQYIGPADFAPKVPPPPPQTIGSIISDTNAFLDGLTENISTLENSLAPILRNEDIKGEAVPPPPGESPLTEALLTINRRISALSSMVRSIKERNTL